MSKNTRKDLLNSPDEFMTTTAAAFKWIRENGRKFMTTVVLIILLAGALTGYYYWDLSREKSAMAEYFKAENDESLNISLTGNYADTNAGKLASLRLAQAAFKNNDYDKTEEHALNFVDNWSQKDILYWEALMLIACSRMANKNNEDALSALNDCTSSSATPNSIREQALFYKALIFLNQGRQSEAREAVQQIEGDYKNLARASLASLASEPGAGNGE